ncbi:alkaline phosphatase [Candidatus Falkowbacteria bacterium RIFCSPLOWO2_12_FULL_45_13]|uniref:Alkaline phosphatase n=2 Tax=Candidatus Falkowiibacteriota TaxID=1752728 RepID=A0A1F5SBS7_9BACT|nr:MAG: alkaline phosphatase [Candidatus Falkowbacteria bacterium RIFCSPLOWO2_02_FULL_45_21]OGF30360.1 MAG: alkaline phosphatase [Candidatus Falkowbacteria bacterium RIFCSPLOWO2_12_FULL_45_13]
MISATISLVTNFIINAISSLGYAGIALMMAIESACIPLPSEVIMPFAGFLAAQGRFSLLGVSLAGAIGCVVGSVIAYAVGVWGGRGFIEKYGKYILISRHDLEVADRFFNKYGASAIFFSRLMPVVRTFISLPAGIAKMDFSKFVIFTFLGSWPWCLGLAYLGKVLGDRWNVLSPYFHKFDFVLIIAIIGAVVWYVRRHIKNVKFKS